MSPESAPLGDHHPVIRESPEVLDSLFALLFVADSPTPLALLANALGITEGQAEQALDLLRQRLDEAGPVQIVQIAGGFQLSTKPEFHPVIAAFLQPQRQRMSKSLMEVLAIAAYKQPITMAEIEAVRGVQSDHSVRALVERRFLHEVGRKQTPGRPVLYGTTQQFLHMFNLNDLSQLPELDLALELESKIQAD